MPDTGKMKRLFHKCTTNLLRSKETMVYPEGDLDGIAEQLSLYVDKMESEAEQQNQIAWAAEHKAGEAIGSMRRAHKTLSDGLSSIPNPNQYNDPDADEDEDEPLGDPGHVSLHEKKRRKKRRP